MVYSSNNLLWDWATYNFSPQLGQYFFSFPISSEKPVANKAAGKAKNPIPKIADIDPKIFPREVIGVMSP